MINLKLSRLIWKLVKSRKKQSKYGTFEIN